jgi:hypothetical protein
MSLTADRQAIRAVLAAAPIVKNASNGLPAQLVAGTAWAQWDGIDTVSLGATNDWVVWYVLGQDLAAAEDKMQDVMQGLWDALRPVMSVSRIEPTTLQQGGATVLVLQVNGRREHT